jgi:hypothetical protein
MFLTCGTNLSRSSEVGRVDYVDTLELALSVFGGANFLSG